MTGRESESDPYVSCENPQKFALSLLDGGAVDQTLRRASDAASVTEYYEGGQALYRGISFLGATFDLSVGFAGDASEFTTPIAGQFVIRLRYALHRVQMYRDPVTNNRLPFEIPNLFSRDEQDVNDVLYRWENQIWLFWNDSAQQGMWVDTVGGTGWQGTNPVFSETEFDLRLAGGSQGKLHHHVRGRRFLDEEHALMLVVNANYDEALIGQQGAFTLGLNAFGVIKARLRK